MSYYKGRLYLYYGITPALILFWPYAAITGQYLFHKQAVTIFCVIGFLTSVGLLCGLWRRYFAEVSVWVAGACVLALGLATGVPVLLSQSDIYQVSISCGYMLMMLALAAIWYALHKPERGCWWLAMASLTYGLAVGARPSLLFGAVVLLVPVFHAWRKQRRIGRLLMASLFPIMLIGAGLILYNAMRFDDPFEFGQRYLLTSKGQNPIHHFSLRYLWFNSILYLLHPVRWNGRFPFVHEIIVASSPAGHGLVENPFGVLINTPFVWLMLGAPLASSRRSIEKRSTVCAFLAAVALLWGTCFLTLSLFFTVCIRYEVDFLPAMMLLAVMGLLGLERSLVDRLTWRRVFRCGWMLLLFVSTAFNLLASQRYIAESHSNIGATLLQHGKTVEALERFQQALRINPDSAETRCNLGLALAQTGRLREAIAQFEQALQTNPNMFEAQANLGHALMIEGKATEAIAHWEQALQINPGSTEVNYDLGQALEQSGRIADAIKHYELALALKPDYGEARRALIRLQAHEAAGQR